MKSAKKFLLSFLIVAFILSLPVVLAQNTTNDEAKNKGYNWLDKQIRDHWPVDSEDVALSLFAMAHDDYLADQGKKALIDKSMNKKGVCWPSTCNTKATALSLLALKRLGENTKEIEDWILDRSKTFKATDVSWYIQLDTDGKASCNISYANKKDKINIDEEKKVSLSGSSSCLSVSQSGGYWLGISSVCLDNTYKIECSEYVTGTLLYSKYSSLYVPSKTEKGEEVEIKIETKCLIGSGNECDYDSTLWAAYALDKADRDVNVLMPYLIANAESKYMSDAFLYIITGEESYAEKLASLQDKQGFWKESFKGRYYDTALAVLALGNYFEGEENVGAAKDYIVESQDVEGSWGSSLQDTSLVLYALWAKPVTYVPTAAEEKACETEGNDCRSECLSDEEELSSLSYSCDLGKVCCKVKEVSAECKAIADCKTLGCDGLWVDENSCKCEYGRERSCEDTCDNDDDGLIDAEDPDCAIIACEDKGYKCCNECDFGHQSEFDDSCPGQVCCSACRESIKEICDNNLDDNFNNLKDCKDPECKDYEKCKGPKLWLIILIILIVGGVIFFIIRRRSFEKRLKSKRAPVTVQTAPLRPGMRPVSTRPISTRPSLGSKEETEEQLKKALKELKGEEDKF